MRTRYFFAISLVLISACAVFFPAASADGADTALLPVTAKPDPGGAAFYITLMKNALARGDYEASRTLGSEGLARYPENATLLTLEGYTLRKTGHYSDAADMLSDAIRIAPSPDRYASRGYAFLARGEYGHALMDAEQGISLDPGFSESYGVKALALQGLGQHAGALSSIEKGLDLEGNGSRAALFEDIKGKVLIGMNDCTGAKEAFETALAMDASCELPWPAFPGAKADLEMIQAVCVR